MIEKSFVIPNNFSPEEYINKIRDRIREISGIEVILGILRPQVPGYKGATYIMGGNGIYVSMWHDPDANKILRDGLKLKVECSYHEDEIYKAILEIYNLRE